MFPNITSLSQEPRPEALSQSFLISVGTPWLSVVGDEVIVF